MEGFKEFDARLKDLEPKVKIKALELANLYLQKTGYDKTRAIQEAIANAQAWFMESEG